MKHGLIAAVLTAAGFLDLQGSPPRDWVDGDTGHRADRQESRLPRRTRLGGLHFNSSRDDMVFAGDVGGGGGGHGRR
jgi:hypothetical protein